MSEVPTELRSTNQEAIHAAGAILWRRPEAVVEVLLVHRDRHGGDWTLPKGKLEHAEGAKQAARRELREETGYEVELGRFVGVVGYEAASHPKVVHFWEASPRGRPQAQRDAEVTATEWLPVDRALERLSYPLERALLAEWIDSGLAEQQQKRVDSRSRASRWLARRSLSARRLSYALAPFWVELASAAGQSAAALRSGRSLEDPRSWTAPVVQLLLESERALDAGEPQLAWRCFKAAARTRLLALQPGKAHDAAVLRGHASGVRREADEKLHSWRKQAIADLLTKKDTQDPALDPALVAEATRILDEHQDNVYDRLGLLRGQLCWLSTAAAFVIVLWTWVQQHVTTLDQTWQAWATVVLLGVMGAILSGFLRVARGRGARIPEQLSNVSLIFARFALAAITAIAAALLIQAEILPFGSSLIWVTAFAAGFSERLVVDALEAMTRRASDGNANTPGAPKAQ